MDFTWIAQGVLDGHRQGQSEGSTYAGVVSRESVIIALTYVALNKLDVIAGDICNAYLQDPSSQKDFIVCGTEFGIENVGKKDLIRRDLYGEKAPGQDFRNTCETVCGIWSSNRVWMTLMCGCDRRLKRRALNIGNISCFILTMSW